MAAINETCGLLEQIPSRQLDREFFCNDRVVLDVLSDWILDDGFWEDTKSWIDPERWYDHVP